MRKFSLYICLLFFMSVNIYSQQISVKTNALMLGGGFPNLGTELVVGKRLSLEISGFGCYKPYKKNIVVLGGNPELKYWFSGRPMARSYIGVNALFATYNLKWKGSVYEGDAGGLGLGFGYSLALSSHWNLEFGAGVGVIYFRQQKYPEGEILNYYYSTNKGFNFMPTKLAVSISYIIK